MLGYQRPATCHLESPVLPTQAVVGRRLGGAGVPLLAVEVWV